MHCNLSPPSPKVHYFNQVCLHCELEFFAFLIVWMGQKVLSVFLQDTFFFYFTTLLYGRKVIKMRQDILVSAVVLVLHFSLFVNEVLFWCEQSASDWQWNVADKSGGFTEDNPAKCNNSSSPRASHAPPPHTQSWPPPQSLLCTSPALLWALWLLTLCPIRMFYFFRFEHTWEEQKRREFPLSPVSVSYCLIVLLMLQEWTALWAQIYADLPGTHRGHHSPQLFSYAGYWSEGVASLSLFDEMLR